MRTFSFLVALLTFVLVTRSAAADPTGAVIVVEVEGDIEDRDALRNAIGAELHATAVGADDPRATSARGTLTIEARGADKRVSATYRSLGAPVSRTVDLPDDPTRARNVAVLLAGNVARQEADELLGRMKAPQPAVVAAVPQASDAADLARLRAMLRDFASDHRRGRIVQGLSFLGMGALELGIGAWHLSEGGAYRERAGLGFVVWGTIDGLFGVLDLAGASRYEDLTDALEKDVRAGVAPEKALARGEERWARAADEAKRARRLGGGLGAAFGALGLGLGLARPVILSESTREREDSSVAISMVAVGGVSLVVGITQLVIPSGIEQSWDVYQRMKAPPAFRPSVGFTPTPGGATIGMGFTF